MRRLSGVRLIGGIVAAVTVAIALVVAVIGPRPSDNDTGSALPPIPSTSTIPTVSGEPATTPSQAPTGVPSSTLKLPAPPHRTGIPAAHSSTREMGSGPPTRSSSLGDLTVRSYHLCSWYIDAKGMIWVRPFVSTAWSGRTGYPVNTVHLDMAGGQYVQDINSTVDAPVAPVFGGDSRIAGYLGRSVTMAATVDAGAQVPESNEANNRITFTITFPGTAPTVPLQDESFTCG